MTGVLGPRRRAVLRGSTDDEVLDQNELSQEELQRRGIELQAALPQPDLFAPKWLRTDRRSSEGREIAEGTVDLAVTAGIWGVILAVPRHTHLGRASSSKKAWLTQAERGPTAREGSNGALANSTQNVLGGLVSSAPGGSRALVRCRPTEADPGRGTSASVREARKVRPTT
jgi:hypothetical protein